MASTKTRTAAAATIIRTTHLCKGRRRNCLFFTLSLPPSQVRVPLKTDKPEVSNTMMPDTLGKSVRLTAHSHTNCVHSSIIVINNEEK